MRAIIHNQTLLENAKTLATAAGLEIWKIFIKGDAAVTYKDDYSPLTIADMAAHDLIVAGLKTLDSTIAIVSEEGRDAVPTGYNGRYWLVDPLDGTKQFVAGDPHFCVNIALIEAQQPVLGVIYIPATKELFWALRAHGAYKETVIEDSEQVSTSEKGQTASPLKVQNLSKRQGLIALASGVHGSPRSDAFMKSTGVVEVKRMGSAIKMCRVAEGMADLYPRFGPTHEWDTAAGHAILNEAGCKLIDMKTKSFLVYSKENFLNNGFVAGRADLDFSPFLSIV